MRRPWRVRRRRSGRSRSKGKKNKKGKKKKKKRKKKKDDRNATGHGCLRNANFCRIHQRHYAPLFGSNPLTLVAGHPTFAGCSRTAVPIITVTSFFNSASWQMEARAEPLYCAEQLCVPPALPDLLKKYSKAAIRANPADLAAWSLKCVFKGSGRFSWRETSVKRSRCINTLSGQPL